MPERTRELSILIIGDLLVFVGALFLTLLLRYFAWPSIDLLMIHIGPFLVMSFLWVVGFYISGLYDKQITPVKAGLVARLFAAQITNVLLAGILFLLLPFGITPKTNLVIYLVVSVVLLTLWRWILAPRLAPRSTVRALLLAEGPEALELVEEVNSNTRYPYYIHSFLEPTTLGQSGETGEKLLKLIEKERISLCIVDGRQSDKRPQFAVLLENLMQTQRFSLRNFVAVYEATFDKVPLSVVNDQWCIDVASRRSGRLFLGAKRVVDIFFGVLLLLLLAVLLPIVLIIQTFQRDTGPLFIAQERVGKYGKPITVYKLRTMTENRSTNSSWTEEDARTGNVVTPVGRILRTLSIDELPQGLSMLRGDMSIIGPRADIVGIFDQMKQEIPQYTIRLLVTPGLSGWAQTNQRYKKGHISPQSSEETKERFAYDLYYVAHRSLLLDVTIILKSLKALIVRMVSIFTRS